MVVGQIILCMSSFVLLYGTHLLPENGILRSTFFIVVSMIYYKVVGNLIDGCGRDNVGILWDCLHPYRYGMDLRETFKEVRDRVHHVHRKDATDLTPWGFTPVASWYNKTKQQPVRRFSKARCSAVFCGKEENT